MVKIFEMLIINHDFHKELDLYKDILMWVPFLAVHETVRLDRTIKLQYTVCSLEFKENCKNFQQNICRERQHASMVHKTFFLKY